MTNTNAILPYATATGANVESPSAWASDTMRQLGLISGIVFSSKLNQALRQASFPAAMIAQFTADYGTSNVNDDGNLSAFETNFVSALTALVGTLVPSGPAVSSLWHIGTATSGTSSALTTTLTPSVSSPAVNLFMAVPITTTNTLTSGVTTIDFGEGPKTIVINNTGVNAAAGAMIGGIGYIAKIYYDGYFARLTNPANGGSDSSLWHIGTAAATSANVYTTTLSPTPDTGATNYFSAIQHPSTNTGAATLNGAPVIINITGAALTGGEIPTAYRAQYFFDGTSQRLINPAPAATPTTIKAYAFIDCTTTPATILSSYNVTSVTRVAAGDYGFTLTNPVKWPGSTIVPGGGNNPSTYNGYAPYAYLYGPLSGTSIYINSGYLNSGNADLPALSFIVF